MEFDFTTMMDRAGRDAIALDIIPKLPVQPEAGISPIPMWVADMSFETAPSITEEIIRRAKHPAFGYFEAREEYYQAILDWQATRNGVAELHREDISYENGVLGCLATALNVFTSPGESVLLHAPTYIGFTHCLEDNGRKSILNPLVQDENGVYRMNYVDMDAKLKAENIHFAVFCSPHNPSGRVWEKEEIEKAMRVYKENDCIVFSDEIWSDLTLTGYQHIPTQSVSQDAKQRTLAVYAPSKTFNLAGLIGSYSIIYSKYLRDRMQKHASATYYNHMNVLSMYALLGAYSSQGAEWTDTLKEVLTHNVEYACEHIQNYWKGVSLAKPEGTYMLYLDCSEWCRETGETLDGLLHRGYRCGVIWQDGRPFHTPNSIRMNLALPFAQLQEALHRLDKAAFQI